MAYYRICSICDLWSKLGSRRGMRRLCRERITAGHRPTRQGAEPKERAGDEDNNNTQGGKVK